MPPLSDSLKAKGIAFRAARAADFPFLQDIHAGFRALEMAFVPWTSAQKRAFLDDQFRLQHLHFTQFFPRADFWIVTRAQPPAGIEPIGRLYLDRSTPMWHVVDIGFDAAERGKGVGAAVLAWMQESAAAAGAEGITLQVMTSNPRARALYVRSGFVPSGPVEGHYEPMAWRVS